MTFKGRKLQNANWSYVPTNMLRTPFTLKSHILLIPSLIWTIFVTLDAPCGLQKHLELQKQQNNVQKIIIIFPQVINMFILLVAMKMQLKCLSYILCHMFQVYKLYS
jgi:hypothetical protein